MKKVMIPLLAAMLIATMICCDGHSSTVENIELKNFANSGCKGNGGTRADDEGRQEIAQYSVLHPGYLYINHQNVMFNCCPGELSADILVSGHLITISESEQQQQCKCICPYDLSYEIGPLTEGETYTILIGRKGNEQKLAEFKFQNNLSGTWSF